MVKPAILTLLLSSTPKYYLRAVVADLYRRRWRVEEAFYTVKRLLGLSYLWTGSINGIKLQVWATWLFYAVLVDLGDAVADELSYHCAIASLLSFYSNGCPHTTAKQVSKLLNLGNQLLHQYIYTLLNTAGLHPNYAILHRNGDHEFPLAWDFAAEFRAALVDDLVLNFARNLLNSHFNGNGNGKKPQTLLHRFLQHWEGQLRTFILHPYAGKVSYRQCMDLQVREYVACLLGDVEYYRPLALKFRPASEVKSQKLKVKREEEGEGEVKSQKLKVKS